MPPEYEPIVLHYFAPPRPSPREILEARQQTSRQRAAAYIPGRLAVAEAERIVSAGRGE